MKKLSIQELTTKLLLVLQRFYLVLIFLIGTALFFFVRINYPDHKLEDSTLAFFILTSLFYIPVSIELIMLALLLAILTGVLAAAVPARRAAALDPVEAIRHV